MRREVRTQGVDLIGASAKAFRRKLVIDTKPGRDLLDNLVRIVSQQGKAVLTQLLDEPIEPRGVGAVGSN